MILPATTICLQIWAGKSTYASSRQVLANKTSVDLTRQCYEKAIEEACSDRDYYVAELEALLSKHTRNKANCSKEAIERSEYAVRLARLYGANKTDALVIRELLENTEDEVATLKRGLEAQVGDRWPCAGPCHAR